MKGINSQTRVRPSNEDMNTTLEMLTASCASEPMYEARRSRVRGAPPRRRHDAAVDAPDDP